MGDDLPGHSVTLSKLLTECWGVSVGVSTSTLGAVAALLCR